MYAEILTVILACAADCLGRWLNQEPPRDPSWLLRAGLDQPCIQALNKLCPAAVHLLRSYLRRLLLARAFPLGSRSRALEFLGAKIESQYSMASHPVEQILNWLKVGDPQKSSKAGWLTPKMMERLKSAPSEVVRMVILDLQLRLRLGEFSAMDLSDCCRFLFEVLSFFWSPPSQHYPAFCPPGPTPAPSAGPAQPAASARPTAALASGGAVPDPSERGNCRLSPMAGAAAAGVLLTEGGRQTPAPGAAECAGVVLQLPVRGISEVSGDRQPSSNSMAKAPGNRQPPPRCAFGAVGPPKLAAAVLRSALEQIIGAEEAKEAAALGGGGHLSQVGFCPASSSNPLAPVGHDFGISWSSWWGWDYWWSRDPWGCGANWWRINRGGRSTGSALGPYLYMHRKLSRLNLRAASMYVDI